MNYLELPDALLTEQELIRLGWLDLFGHMKDICDTLNIGGGLDWLHLPPGAKLLYEKPSQTELRIIYRVGASEYAMWLTVDLDLGFVRYGFDPSFCTFQRVITTRGQEAFFSDRGCVPPIERTMEEAAKGLIFEFLMLDE
jgi:hypothetical protein